MSNWNAKNEMIHLLKRCRDRPELFNKLFLNRPAYWSRQMDLCRSVVEHRTTVAYSGNMVGKDYWIAGIIIWWLLTRPDSLCIITGPSQMVLGSVTFKEIRRCLDGAVIPFGGKLSSGIKASPAVIEVAPGWQSPGVQYNERGAVVGATCQASPDRGRGSLGSRGFRLRCDRLAGLRASGVHRQSDPGGRQVRGLDPPGRPRSGRQCAPSPGRQRHPDSEHGIPARARGEERIRVGRSNLAREHVPQVRPAIPLGRIAHRRPHSRCRAEQLIDPAWLDYHSSQQRPPVPPTHPVNFTRRIACDLSEGVGRDSTCIVVVDDWGVLEVVLGNSMGLPEAAETIQRLTTKWNVPHDKISFDKLGIG